METPSHPASAGKAHYAEPTPNILNVFFHGLFVFIDRPSGIDVLLPEVPDHSYRAGSFLGETQIVQPTDPVSQPLVLTGVQTGCAHLPEDRNLVVDGAEPDDQATPNDLHAVLWVPLPDKIVAADTVSIAGDLDNASAFSKATLACYLHVFQYRFFGSADTVLLRGHRFLPSLETIDGIQYMSLHIFSEEDTRLGSGHPITGFDRAVDLLPSLRGKVHLTRSTTSPGPSARVSGTIPAEYEDLQIRTEERLRLIGSAMRQGDWPRIRRVEVDRGTSVSTCTAIVSKFTSENP